MTNRTAKNYNNISYTVSLKIMSTSKPTQIGEGYMQTDVDMHLVGDKSKRLRESYFKHLVGGEILI